ncbi:hypothetical protein [Alishewanella longhuensis]
MHILLSKLFVQTEFLPDYNALIATRRTRKADESAIWLAHFAVVEGEQCADAALDTAEQDAWLKTTLPKLPI